MSLRLIKPGLGPVAKFYPRQHSLAGQRIEPIGYVGGKAVWPVAGGAEDQDDPDADPDEDEDEDEEDEEDDKKSSKKSSKKDEDDEEDEDDSKSRPARQAARYRTRLREKERELADVTSRLKALEDKDKKPDEVTSRDLVETRERAEKAESTIRTLTAQLAFFKTPVPGIIWADASDVFALAEREGLFEDVIDEDGTVDARELRRGLKDLAKRKPHLVQSEDTSKARGRKDKDDDDEEEDEDEQSSTGPKPMNRTRRGTKGTTDRAALAKRFPVLGRM